jgi:RNA polymerase sigma-70 factor, ECF subfamily
MDKIGAESNKPSAQGMKPVVVNGLAAPCSIADLIQQAQQGSATSLGELLERCRKYLLLVAHRELDPLLRPKAGASDLVQETFYNAQRGFNNFRGTTQQEFIAWLTAIMRHRLANHARQFRGSEMRDVSREVSLQSDSNAVGLDLHAGDATPSDVVMAGDEQSQLMAAIDRLPPSLHRVLVMRTWERASFVEIGLALEMSADAARKQWCAAMHRLQRELRRHHEF